MERRGARENEKVDPSHTFQKTLIAIAAILGVFLLWYAHDVFLTVFAGLLFGILLRGLANILGKYTKLSHGLALFLTVFVLIFLSAALINGLAPGVDKQVAQLEHDLPRSLNELRSYIGQYQWGRDLLDNLPSVSTLASDSSSFMRHVTGVFSASFNVILHIVLILVIGIYFAAEPSLYRGGFLEIIPPVKRQRINSVLTNVHNTLWWWILSIMGSMISVSILAFIGLSILGIPLAMTLAIITGLLTFIPNFGPIASAIPPALLGLMESPAKALSVILMYVIIQGLESHFVTPLIQRHTIKMPPVLGICAQLLFSLLFGFMGLLLAIPLVATIMVLVKTLYIDEVLESGLTSGIDEIGANTATAAVVTPKQTP